MSALSAFNQTEEGCYLQLLFEISVDHCFKKVIFTFIIMVLMFELIWDELSMIKTVKQFVPKSNVLIILGLLSGGVSLLIFKTESDDVPDFFFYWFSHDYIFEFLLPPIILEATMELYSREAFLALDMILDYALVGTLFNIFAIGLSLWGVYAGTYLIPGNLCSDADGPFGAEGFLIDFLIYASILSAVDPVAVLSVFEELGVDKSLSVLILGESLLNDGVTVVFYEGLIRVKHLKDPLNAGGYACIFASFFTSSLGGLLLGVIYGFFACLLCKSSTFRSETLQVPVVFGYAYLSFVNAQYVSWSGIMAIIGYGIVTKRYTFQNLSCASRDATKSVVKVFSHAAESIIFLLFGISAFNLRALWTNEGDIEIRFWLFSFLFCTVYRIVSVCVIGKFINWSSDVNLLNKRTLTIMSWGGLRGAVSFVMAQHLATSCKTSYVLSGTIFVILVTCILQGGTIEFVVKGLKMFHPKEKTTDREKVMVDSVMWVSQRTMSGMAVILGGSHILGTCLHKWIEVFDHFDREYIMAFFCHTRPSSQSDEACRINQKLKDADVKWKGPWSKYEAAGPFEN